MYKKFQFLENIVGYRVLLPMHDTKVTCPSIICNIQFSVTSSADEDDDVAGNNVTCHVVLTVLKCIRGHWRRDRLRLHFYIISNY